MVKVEELQNLSKEELIEKEGQLKKQLMQLRFDAKLGKLEKHSTIKEMRRDIARVLTVLSQQRLGQKPQAKKVNIATEAKPQSVTAEMKSRGKTSAAGSKTQSHK